MTLPRHQRLSFHQEFLRKCQAIHFQSSSNLNYDGGNNHLSTIWTNMLFCNLRFFKLFDPRTCKLNSQNSTCQKHCKNLISLQKEHINILPMPKSYRKPPQHGTELSTNYTDKIWGKYFNNLSAKFHLPSHGLEEMLSARQTEVNWD